jgi:hypothetical protein
MTKPLSIKDQYTNRLREDVFKCVGAGPILNDAIALEVIASKSCVRARLFELEAAGKIARTGQVRPVCGGVQYVWHLPGVVVTEILHSPEHKAKVAEAAATEPARFRDPLTAALFGAAHREAA